VTFLQENLDIKLQNINFWTWAKIKLNKILDYVYQSSPVKETDFGESIGFSLAIEPIESQKRKQHIELETNDSVKIQSML